MLIGEATAHSSTSLTNACEQVCLQFYEKRQKTGGWFGRQEERLYWEQW